ncbi:MAG: PKD-like family lipoprotein [Carboxylicivirga sp.]|nr:PKD-like family lipoprotein [Carboxylicivirga sp.]
MKKIIQSVIVLILIASACTEDKGTYDYSPLNEVIISDIMSEYTALSEAPFSITPSIEQKLLDDESVLEYVWYAYEPKAQMLRADTLAFSKELDLDSLKLDPNNYVLVFKATDTSTGIYYDSRSTLDVKGFPDGLQVLSNKEGYAQVSILRGEADGLSDFEAYKVKNNNDAVGTNPVSIVGINEYGRTGKPYRVAIYCNDNQLGAYVKGSNFEKTINVVDAFVRLTPPTSVSGKIGQHTSEFGFPRTTGIHANNQLYTTFQPGGYFGEECSFVYSFEDVSSNFKAPFKFLGYILFNPTTTGFCEIDDWGSRISQYPPEQPGPDDPEPAFDRSNTGLSAIYGKKVSDYAMGVFEDAATNQKFILGLLNKEAAFKKEMTGEDLDNATTFEFLNSKQVLLYAYANKIFTYDVVANKVLYSYELEEEAIINHMEVSADDKRLYIGVNDGSNDAESGSVYIMNIDLDGEVLDVVEAYENKFGKVVDFLENY